MVPRQSARTPNCLRGTGMRYLLLAGTLITILSAAGLALGQENPPVSSPNQGGKIQPTKILEEKNGLSDAEKMLRLRRTLENDKKNLEEYKAELKDPESEFYKAETKFGEIDDLLHKSKEELTKLKALGKTKEVEAQEEKINKQLKEWQAARDHFNLVIKEWRTLREQVKSLPKKIEEDQAALNSMLGITPASKTTPTPSTKKETPPENSGQKGSTDKTPESPAKAPEENKTPSKKEIIEAKGKLKKYEALAKQAKDKELAISNRLDKVRRQIELENNRRQTNRQKADLQYQRLNVLTKELSKKEKEDAPQAEIEALLEKIREIETESAETRHESRQISDRLTALQKEQNALLSEQLLAAREAQGKERKLQVAQEELSALQNPYTARNIMQWLLDHGPKIALIVICMVLLIVLSRTFSKRLVRIITARSRKKKSEKEREERTATLVSVFRSTFRLLILFVGILMLLDEIGVPIITMLSGAAVVGLAIAFAAQNLLRDYLNGFNILLEDQYGINDVIKVNDLAGQVEKISLRITTLRDLEGTLHIIPHGSITAVSNLTHSWSRVKLDIGVAYKEDVDRVMEILMEEAFLIRQDPTFGPLIIDNPEMLGVDAFADSAVVIRLLLKTKPLKQWLVKREMLRRIKNKFDAQNIEIPFPHRTVYHHYENSGAESYEVSKPLAPAEKYQ